MYLPPNPLKGNREKFDNVQISRKSKVESSRVSNYSEPETQNPKLILSSNPQILKQISATRNPELAYISLNLILNNRHAGRIL
jgi:hypothetical protein